MSNALFATEDLDLALTKIAACCPVLYTGPHQGVFRFESVKLAAIMSSRGVQAAPFKGEAGDAATASATSVAARIFHS